jgi:hypothetical protein
VSWLEHFLAQAYHSYDFVYCNGVFSFYLNSVNLLAHEKPVQRRGWEKVLISQKLLHHFSCFLINFVQ